MEVERTAETSTAPNRGMPEQMPSYVDPGTDRDTLHGEHDWSLV